MRKFLIFCILLLWGNAFAATDFFPATCLTGGTTGCIDAIDITNDGITDGDKLKCQAGGKTYYFHYDDDNGSAESSPDVIAPDKDGGVAYAGDGRWINDGYYGASFQGPSGASITEFSIDETMAGDSDDAVPTEQAVKAAIDSATKFTDRGDAASADYEVGDLTTDGTWNNLDLSAVVTAGATAVLLKIRIVDETIGNIIKFRKDGNSNEINISEVEVAVANVSSRAEIIVPVPASRIIEYWATNTTITTITIVIKGWWK